MHAHYCCHVAAAPAVIREGLGVVTLIEVYNASTANTAASASLAQLLSGVHKLTFYWAGKFRAAFFLVNKPSPLLATSSVTTSNTLLSPARCTSSLAACSVTSLVIETLDKPVTIFFLSVKLLSVHSLIQFSL
eukprot:TRINITY_DN18451_c0_g2_i1.p2 TRINITY_DN18451_c0_g2~~TRINITY_DN18451_c0_g2_i1.p2  ORF type:complete len:133 (+),score=31.62 TRINITY_DN18451_c0_g2_i1:343-741(+)